MKAIQNWDAKRLSASIRNCCYDQIVALAWYVMDEFMMDIKFLLDEVGMGIRVKILLAKEDAAIATCTQLTMKDVEQSELALEDVDRGKELRRTLRK